MFDGRVDLQRERDAPKSVFRFFLNRSERSTPLDMNVEADVYANGSATNNYRGGSSVSTSPRTLIISVSSFVPAMESMIVIASFADIEDL